MSHQTRGYYRGREYYGGGLPDQDVLDWEVKVIHDTNRTNQTRRATMYRNFVQTGAKAQLTWRGKLKFIRDQQAELNANLAGMSEFERRTYSENIQNVREQLYGEIVRGMLVEHAAAIEHYQTAGTQVEQARAAEVDRWQADKLNAELTTARTLVELASHASGPSFGNAAGSAGSRLRALYQEAKASGNAHKQRAALEVLQALDVMSLPADDRPAALSLATQAKQDLAELRTTPEIRQALEAQAAAAIDLMAWHGETGGLRDIAKQLGVPDPATGFGDRTFVEAYQSVRVQDGQIVIASPAGE